MKHKQVGIVACLLLAMSVASQASTTLTRTTAFQYDVDGFLTKQTIEPGNPAYQVDTKYSLDAFGNATGVTVSSPATGAAAVAARTNTAVYDSTGRFQTSAANALSQAEIRQYDTRFGTVTALTGPNGLTTNWQYDSFGRKTRETRADGTSTAWSYIQCNSGTCPGNQVATASYWVQQTPLAADGVTQNGPLTTVYYSNLDQEIRRETTGFDGTSVIVVLTQYDSLGRVSAVSQPFYNGSTVYWTTTQYDALSRPVSVTAPDGTVTRYGYNGLTSSVTNANNQTTSKTKNSQGQDVRIVDAANSVLSLAYDPFGNLTQSTDPVGNRIVNSYDLYGHKLSTQDPDMGLWRYAYDGFGQLIQQTDAKGQVASYQYDALGRMVARGEADLNSTWIYDSCSQGIGKLCEAKGDNGYDQKLAYDSLSRPASSNTTIDTSYTISNQYDANGRLLGQTYPTGFALQYVYTSLGYLAQVKDAASGQLYWKANTYDAAGHLLEQQYGNNVVTDASYDLKTGRLTQLLGNAGAVLNLSYQYDAIGNLLNRTDSQQNVNENLAYDALNRLTASQLVNLSGMPTISYGYDALGNITSRSDVGTYSYGSKPHAVSAIAGAINTSFSYDANGNQLTGNGRTVTYTSYNLPSQIQKGSASDSFLYGTEHQRIKQTSSATGTTYYVNPDNAGGLMFEKEVKTSGVTENHHYLSANGQTFAEYVTRSDGTKQMNYWHQDKLGSLAAVTDATGAVVERLSYEPFGKRRFSNGSSDPANTLTGQTTERGYTGDEHLDEVGLIHMNGRVYDPQIGRFLEADPNVPNALWLQDYNRYSYTTNNPFTFTDPTGFDEEDSGGGWFSGVSDWFSGFFGGSSNNNTGTGASEANTGAPTGGSPTTTVDSQVNTPSANNNVAGNGTPPDQSYLGNVSQTNQSTSRNQLENLYQSSSSSGQDSSFSPVLLADNGTNWKQYTIPGDPPARPSSPQSFWESAIDKAQNFAEEAGRMLQGVPGEALIVGGVRSLAIEATVAKEAGVATDFFAGTKYTDKVLGQMKQGDLHAFPESVKGFQEAGQISKLTGGDGVVRDMLKIPGEYRGKEGFFEFIKEVDGAINHRFFRQNQGQ